MRDPFPIPPIPALSKAVQPWADYFELPTLPLHIHEVVLMAAFYHVIGSVVSPILSRRLFPTHYSALSPSRRLNWDVHVVSFVQSTTINILALWVMFVDDERKNMDWQERIWGYTGAAAMIQALAAGYFLWDLIMTASHINIFGLGMLAHAISALLVYSFGFVSLHYLGSWIKFADRSFDTDHGNSARLSTTIVATSSFGSCPLPFSTSTGSSIRWA